MNKATILDREELKQQLLEHMHQEAEQLAGELSGVLEELLQKRDPIQFEHAFADAIRRFGAGMLGRGLREIEPRVKEETKKGPCTEGQGRRSPRRAV